MDGWTLNITEPTTACRHVSPSRFHHLISFFLMRFSLHYQQYMDMLQGKRIPSMRVNLFLIVNPPRWFNKVWALMTPMLSEEFSKKSQMIPESLLSKFSFAPGFQTYLPDEMAIGQAKTDAIVDDFILFRLYREQPKVCPASVKMPKLLADRPH